MFNRRSISSAVTRTAATLIVAGIALSATALPASAQALAGGGKIYASVACYTDTNNAYVNVSVQNPDKFKSTGLVYYTQLWAKASSVSTWTFLSQAQSGTIKTYKTSGAYSWNEAKLAFSGTFHGADTQYDVLIQYWYRVPSSSSWAGPYVFTVPGDASSGVTVYRNDGFGYIGNWAPRCAF